MFYFICRTNPCLSKKKRRTGILGNNEESDGEMDNLPSPAAEDEDPGNVNIIYIFLNCRIILECKVGT